MVHSLLQLHFNDDSLWGTYKVVLSVHLCVCVCVCAYVCACVQNKK